MKKLGKLKLWGLLVFILVALVFVGINLLDAQVELARKGPKPRLSWTVRIPTEVEAVDSNDILYNLFRENSSEDYYYDDTGEGDGILIDVLTSSSGNKAGTTLRLAVGNNLDESGNCWPWDNGPKKIGFQGIVIGDQKGTDYWFADTIEDEFPCFFPPIYSPSSPYFCDEPDINSVPQCMADFFNNYLHPYCDPNCPYPVCSYRLIEIKIQFNRFIEDITEAEDLVPVTGIIWIRLINTFELQSGCEYPHNVEGYYQVEYPDGSFLINKKADVDNTWTVNVDGDFTFAEIYKGAMKGKGKKGRGSWEYKIPYWAQIPLYFVTEWTREQ